MAGASYSRFQIPNTPGLTPNFTAFGVSTFNSPLLNENQLEQNYYGVAALQRSINGADVQVSYFTRYSSVHFTPDPIGDLVFNGVASNVFRSDFANGVATDAAYRLNDAHTLRGGFLLRTDLSNVVNTNTLLPVVDGVPVDAPFTVTDPSQKLGYTVSFYVQDEWRITNWLILSTGLRYDQYWAYISENQFSPRFSLTWKPFETTTFHAGYARTFTPPEQVLAAPTNLALVQGTTEQPSVPLEGPVRAERADVYDVGVVQQVLPGLEVGIDGYYKRATNLIDDGGPNDRGAVALQRQDRERPRGKKMLLGAAAMIARVADRGDDRRLIVSPAVGGDAGVCANLRARAIGGNKKARSHHMAIGKRDVECRDEPDGDSHPPLEGEGRPPSGGRGWGDCGAAVHPRPRPLRGRPSPSRGG